MYSYEWDETTGGLLLTSTPLTFSKEPRPVYYKELDILGFDKHWRYEKNDNYPYMWAETNNYWYRGRKVAQTKGGSLYTAPEIMLLEDPEPDNAPLRLVDIPTMVEKNRDIMEMLVQDTIKKVFNIYIEYRNKVDLFYVAFSGGKDSVVVLDIVQRALPHNMFKVIFGDTRMECQDTYELIDKLAVLCKKSDIEFLRAQSKQSTEQTWSSFGPPSATNRWCCSVHKTAPQIILLRQVMGKKNFSGMAFTGIRADESIARSEYNDVSFGEKHQGQFSCHPLLEWNSVELYSYIYQNSLIINESYKKGLYRVGCLVCPMSAGKHEYMKHQWYQSDVDDYLKRIELTSGKSSFSKADMRTFIDEGHWRKRRTGRELNFGQDQHVIELIDGKERIVVHRINDRWKEWTKTIGPLIENAPNCFVIDFQGYTYSVVIDDSPKGKVFTFPNCGTNKNDLKFMSLIKSSIIKSLYCIGCGVCVAECSHDYINMDSELKISENCAHCYRCHDIHEHCLRYCSIRNKIGVERAMKGIDRYFSFGVRLSWMRTYFKYEGSAKFWDTDGDTMVPNKKKDAFLTFVKDAGLVDVDKMTGHNNYTKHVPTQFARTLMQYDADSSLVWALLLCNLSYTTEFKWFVKNIPFGEIMTPDRVKAMLEYVMENDSKGLGKRNIVDALKILLIKTPLGKDVGLGICDYEEKISSTGNETITLNTFTRIPWQSPDPRVILYALYKFAEACGDYYSFTLTRLLNHDIDSAGVSPTEIFGLGRDEMEKLLNGLSINHPEFINASFTHDLDNITLRSEKFSKDVLDLF